VCTDSLDAPHGRIYLSYEILTAERSCHVANERALKLYVVLARAAMAVDAHSRADISRHGLSQSEFAALEALYHRGPMLVGEVKKKILVSSGGITYVIDRLAARGLVERRSCPEDRRAAYAALTPAGTALMEEIFPDHARCIEHAVSGLTAREQEAATVLLRKLGTVAASLHPRTPDG
jgi:MarR family transcriptional regulator, 2-MHQ and catechol-resistance regulon repressor